MANNPNKPVSDSTASPGKGERLVYVIPEGAFQAGDELSLLDLWTILWRAKYFIVALTAVFAVAAVAYALTATKWYEAQVLMSPAEENSLPALSGTLGGLASLAGMNVGGGDDTVALAVLKSRGFTEAFIQEYGLLPMFFPDSFVPEQNGSGADGNRPDVRDGIRFFSDNVRTVTKDPETGLITLSIQWKDPELAAEWANLLVTRLNDRMRQEALKEAETNISYLKSELEKTNVVTLQQSIGRLMESELQKLMLARGDKEFAFKVIDRAQVPNERSKPQRTLIVVLATFVGGALAVLIVMVRRAVERTKSSRPELPG